ncbi:hypothetical protein BGX23_009162 [Mortierella sp. AD031]|nr:hypothetical protein BGX23_009162 [Mortierella sp. AD031]
MVAADPGSDPSTNAAAASFLRRVFSHMSTTSENQNRLYLLCLMHRGAEDYKDKKDEMDAALEDMVMTVLMDTTVIGKLIPGSESLTDADSWRLGIALELLWRKEPLMKVCNESAYLRWVQY